jgi:BMFP domain-containing protein YqiC
MHRGKANVLGLAALTILAVGTSAPAAEPAQSPREVVEQQLREQIARNEQLQERIEKLEAILKTDICADPQAAQQLLQETQPQQPSPR